MLNIINLSIYLFYIILYFLLWVDSFPLFTQNKNNFIDIEDRKYRLKQY